MKKLISIFGALTLTATTTVLVVSCTNLDNFNEIKDALDNEESMIVFISAKDCEHCETFKRDINKYNELVGKTKSASYSSFENMYTEIAKNSYNSKIAPVNKDPDEYKLTKFGETIDKVTFKEFEAESYKNLFEEKWLISLKDLIRDQLRDIFSFGTEDLEQKYTKDQMNQSIDANYLGGLMNGTPSFLHFRSGKFIGSTVWDYKPSQNDDDTFTDGMQKYVFELINGKEKNTPGFWVDTNLSNTLFKIISKDKETESPAPEE